MESPDDGKGGLRDDSYAPDGLISQDSNMSEGSSEISSKR